MRLPATKVILFNAGAILVTSAAVLAAARSMLFTPDAAPCSERYHSMTRFALERAGTMLTAVDLQAGLGGRDAGVIDNVSITRFKDAPAPVAMGVSLRKGSASPRRTEGPKGGMSFAWQPRALAGRSAACLAYHVLLPADFDFHRGGTLPGISGGQEGNQGDGFVAALAWRPKGGGGATLRVRHGGTARAAPAERTEFSFARGRWVKLEQEVVLNTPKAGDGILRVWVDGALAVERTDLTYRGGPEVTIAGVSADVHYGAEDARGAAPKDASVWLTPFEVRWQ
jgi:hypothetical protein